MQVNGANCLCAYMQLSFSVFSVFVLFVSWSGGVNYKSSCKISQGHSSNWKTRKALRQKCYLCEVQCLIYFPIQESLNASDQFHRVFTFIVGIQFWHICFQGLFLSFPILILSSSFSLSITPPPSLSLSLFNSLPLPLTHTLPHLSISLTSP